MSYILDKAKSIIDLELEGIRCIREQLGNGFEQLVDACKTTLDKGGKIVVSGIGKSGHIGHKIAATLASTGSPAMFLHPVEAMHGDLGVLQKNDILLALSYSGETDELLPLLPSAKRLDIPIAAITGNPNSNLAKWSNIVILMSIDKEACPFNLAPTTSTTALLIIGDALAMVLLDIRGFTMNDFGRLHPGGAIGRSVTLKVTDIMRSDFDNRLVKVTSDTTVKDTILDMTQKRSGCAVVVDNQEKLLGIFTDGDFRRNACDLSILSHPVKKFMGKNPVSVFSDQMAVNVLKLVESKKVDDVVVIDRDNKVVGIVDAQDLPGLKLM
jgi:arabinose-5-phosphate isomerase